MLWLALIMASSAVAGSANHTGRVVCCKCGHHSRNVHGHQIHCSDRQGSKVRCQGATCIPFSDWKKEREQELAAKGVRDMAAAHFVDSEADFVNSAFNNLYYNKMTPQTTIDSFGELLKDHDARCKAELIRRLGDGKTPAEKDELAQTIADVFSASSHVETKGELYARVQPAPARRRDLVDRPDKHGRAQGPRRGDHVYDVPICDGLKTLVRDNPHLLTTWQQAADNWARPEAGESITVYSDITDGSVFREHPELGINADRSDNSLRLGFIIYYDEVEVCNAIGHNCGVHKIGLFYWGILNYHASVRMDLNNIQLATVVLDADVFYYGVEQIVSGPPAERNWPHGTSIGASLRALDSGIKIPQSEGGRFTDILMRGWLIIVSADNPAAALLTGTMIATGANRFCRQCTIDRTKVGFDAPCSFVSNRAPTPELRTQAGRRKDMQDCGNDQKKMHAAGWKSWSHAFTRCGPHFDFLVSVPEDVMHDLFEGITKGELAHFIFYCEREKGFFKLDDLNKWLDRYDWPGGSRPCPYFTRSFLLGETATTGKSKAAKRKKQTVEEGEEETESAAAGFVPKSGAHVSMTAGQMLTFARHSTQLFINLGVPLDDPAFQAWQTHITLINLLMQHSLTPEEIQEIDKNILSHQEQLRALAHVYPNIWKPKHHYVCHFPLDILHFGPARHYWCMRFEAMNQVFKKIAVGGSYRDTTRRLAEFWCMRSALARQRGRPWEDWANTRAVQGTAILKLARKDASDHTQAALEAFSDSFGDVVTTSLISELQHDGHTITEECWLYLKLDSQEKPILVSLNPQSAMFTMDNATFFHVMLFPDIELSTPTPLYTCTIPAASEPISDIVALDEIIGMNVLWPSFSELSACERDEEGDFKLVFTQI